MKVLEFPTKQKSDLITDFQDGLFMLYNEKRFDDLTVAEMLGVMEMFKWDIINQMPTRGEGRNDE